MFLRDSKTTSTTSTPPGTPPTARASADAAKTASGIPSIISPDLKIVGNLKSSGDIQVDGRVEGDIDSRLLIVGAGARIEGSITAETVRVSGAVHGQIKAKSVTLDKTAKVVGDVIHENLTMEAGAFLEGGVRRIESASSANIAPLRPASAGNGQQAGYGEPRQSSVL